ncbi:hypothetical protein OSB04_031832 [Centaurea solstitialis]|uniref:Putative plant transposon protein domain-containing protein n=1 Tax=Centaurea solstitialis TaxID=347529 RepID=A0AA38S9R7_9ASTR|nr:hypothetical protein OSB04_031832 [Centaurea solstitialis]
MFLVFGGSEDEISVTGYSDASFQTDRDDFRSQSGYVFTLNGGAISWKSSKQDTIADSTTEAEYIAASDAAKEAVWLRNFLSDLRVVASVSRPIDIFCDNSGAVAQAKEPREHHKSRHVLRKYHLIREIIGRGDVRICKIPTEENVADPLTKPLVRVKHEAHANSIGMQYLDACFSLSLLPSKPAAINRKARTEVFDCGVIQGGLATVPRDVSVAVFKLDPALGIDFVIRCAPIVPTVPNRVYPKTLVHAYPEMKRVVEAMKWETLFDCIGEYNLDWVREFFTELAVTPETELMVRQTPVSYSAEGINELLGLTPPEESEYDRLQTQATPEDYDMLLERLSVEGSGWDVKYKQKILKGHTLKGETNVWFYFMRHTLFPTSHDTDLDMDRVYYLYCIVEGHQFDVGALISKAMRYSIEKGNKQLPYPSIIQKLLEKAKVPSLSTDKFNRDKVVIDKQSLLRLLRFPNAPEAGGQTSNS